MTATRPSSRTRRLLAAAGTTGLLVGLLAACGSSGSSKAAAPTTTPSAGGSTAKVDLADVTLNIGDQAGTGAQTLLTAAGLIDKLPFKVKWDDFTSGPPILQAEAAGAVDVGSVGNAPPVFAAAGGAPVEVVGALKANANSGAVLVPKGSAITSVSQLKGKKIAVAQGSSGDYHILAALKKAGLSAKDVDLDYLQPAAGLAAFNSGAVQAWTVWAPYLDEAIIKYGARKLTNLAPYGQTYSFEVASKSAMGDPAKAAAIKAYVGLLNQAYTWSDTHPAQWATVWGQATGLDSAIMDQAARDNTDTPTPITGQVIDAQQSVVNTFYQAGLIPKTFPFSSYTYAGFNSLYPS